MKKSVKRSNKSLRRKSNKRNKSNRKNKSNKKTMRGGGSGYFNNSNIMKGGSASGSGSYGIASYQSGEIPSQSVLPLNNHNNDPLNSDSIINSRMLPNIMTGGRCRKNHIKLMRGGDPMQNTTNTLLNTGNFSGALYNTQTLLGLNGVNSATYIQPVQDMYTNSAFKPMV